jgi:nitrite reductase/ring-hydroxylating ferredoxin subunit
LSEAFVPAIRADEVAPGGMKAVELDGREIVICNCGGTYHAIQRRCGHMNAPLELGTLDGNSVTCGMHCVQFDVTTGTALSGPVPPDLGDVSPPPAVARFLRHVGAQMAHVRVESLRIYATKVEGGWVLVAP